MGRRPSNLSQLLSALKQGQLNELAKAAGITLSQRKQLEPIRQELLEQRERVNEALAPALRKFGRDDLKPLCKTLGLSDSGRTTDELVQRLVAFAMGTSSSEPNDNSVGAQVRSSQPERSIFVVHGHDQAMRIDVTRILERLGIKSIVLFEEPNNGLTILEKLEKQIGKCTHAIVLLSPDDVGRKTGHDTVQKERARQNVILELGIAIGKLGRQNVIVLHRGDVELPSDIYGLLYISYMLEDHRTIVPLAKELRSMGYDVDINRVI